MAVNRFAGYRLAGENVEDISNDLKIALENLASKRRKPERFDGITQSVPVPGVDGATVRLDVSHDLGPSYFYDREKDQDRKVIGNLEDALMVLDEHRPSVSLSWDHTGPYDMTPKERLRVARTAERGWKQVIPQIPEGAIVSNTPVGGLQGDFERTDLYMRGGFGPLQEDGAQYGFVKNGQINPLSPGVVNPMYATHLSERAAAAGNAKLSEAIKRQVDRKLTNDVPENAKLGYDDYEDDYDPEWEEMQARLQELRDDPDEVLAYKIYGTTPDEQLLLDDYRVDQLVSRGGYGGYNSVLHPNRPDYRVIARGPYRRTSRRPPATFDPVPVPFQANAPVRPIFQPAEQQPYSNRAEFEPERNMAEMEEWFNSEGQRGEIYRSIYGANVGELTAGLSPNSALTDREARQILHSAATQPGRFDREEVGRAYLTMQERLNNSF